MAHTKQSKNVEIVLKYRNLPSNFAFYVIIYILTRCNFIIIIIIDEPCYFQLCF